jgi:hypothetical protein
MQRTVETVLTGGLGNQLFQYAAGRALAERIGGRLVLDLSEFRRDVVYKRVYLLDRFPITGVPRPSNALASMRWTFDRAVRKFPRLAEWLGRLDEPLAEGVQVFDPRLLAPPQHAYLSLRGYWQNEGYFQDAADVIRRELTPPIPGAGVALRELSQIRSSAHPVGIGIRFFREVPGGGADPRQMLAAFREQITAHAAKEPGCSYFVFSDEPEHLRSPDCLGVPFTLITPRPKNENAPIDLCLMSHCRTFFIGYSSFHWWGAWLAASRGKHVNYLHFPGRPCNGYAAATWQSLPIALASCHDASFDGGTD